MSRKGEQLYQLLPAVYRNRDAELGEPLRQLIEVLAEQAAVVEENIDQLSDDLFIETCADWVVPYIGGLIGYRPLHGVIPSVASPRREAAKTIGYRRRLGTAGVIEELAEDVTGWAARVVEYFLLVATTQHMNHIRPAHHLTPHLSNWEGLERLGSAFDPFTRTVDVRSIGRQQGRYNLPNVGIFLWRLQTFGRLASPAVEVDAQRFLISPLGAPVQLVHSPQPEASVYAPATPLNVPDPLSRRVLSEAIARQGESNAYYGEPGSPKSVLIALGGTALSAGEVQVCDLSDDGAGWANVPQDGGGPRAVVDPVLGRIALAPGETGPVAVSYHFAFGAPMGGGDYDRLAGMPPTGAGSSPLRVPNDHPDIQNALDDLPVEGGVVEITDNGRYEQALHIEAPSGASIEVRAADGVNPLVVLPEPLRIAGEAGSRVVLDGLLIAGAPVVVPDEAGNELAELELRHVTLVPGLALDGQGNPQQAGAVSLEVAATGVEVRIDRCICGPLRVRRNNDVRISGSIVDAAAADPLDSADGVAFAAPGAEPAEDFGGTLEIAGSTVFGRVATERMRLASNSILSAYPADDGPWSAPVRVQRRQQGCVRFTYVPPDSVVPRRYRCQPQLAIDRQIAAAKEQAGGPIPPAQSEVIARREARRVMPGFTSRRYGRPAYAQLRRSTASEIAAGADDESEMGAFHSLYQPQREANLRIRLDEYLRFGLEAGTFFET